MLPENLRTRHARGAALPAAPVEGIAKGYARLFDTVQAIAFEQEAAGGFDDGPRRSAHALWTWRAFLAEAVEDADKEEPATGGGFLNGYA